MVLTVVGLGFVGLTAAVGFAVKGHTVYAIEKNDERRNKIESGKLPFFEPEIQENLLRTLNKNLFLQSGQKGAAEQSDCVFYCVGTPVGENASADLTHLLEAVQETLFLLPKDAKTTLVVKSTVPPGTLRDRIYPVVCEHGFTPGKDVELANNPEFLREGKCWEDFIRADRIVIGAFTDRGYAQAARVYRDFSAPVERVNPTTAEFIKYLSNTLLATMISYSNEMANAADKIHDVEIGRAFHILHKDRRWEQNVMSSYVYPGCGYGGYCLPKDTQAMCYAAAQADADMPILRAVIKTNEKMPETICDRLLEGSDEKITVGILGLSFKPFTDDVRDTPAAKIIRTLQTRGIKSIMAYDPLAQEEFFKHYPDLKVTYADSVDEMMKNCDRLAIVTAWPEFEPYCQSEKVWDFRYMHQ
ncbi:MAG: UDP-glucose dehydrogenase family protein [Acutalibacteraceae bacterium]